MRRLIVFWTQSLMKLKHSLEYPAAKLSTQPRNTRVTGSTNRYAGATTGIPKTPL
jgi:hypothetical protein